MLVDNCLKGEKTLEKVTFAISYLQEEPKGYGSGDGGKKSHFELFSLPVYGMNT